MEQQAIASADLPKSRELNLPVEGQKQYDAGIRLRDSAKFSEALAAFKEAKGFGRKMRKLISCKASEARLHLYKEAAESFRRAVKIWLHGPTRNFVSALFPMSQVAECWPLTPTARSSNSNHRSQTFSFA